ncbi:hypothetical protein ACLOJK_014621 [Asimina triloba]
MNRWQSTSHELAEQSSEWAWAAPPPNSVSRASAGVDGSIFLLSGRTPSSIICSDHDNHNDEPISINSSSGHGRQ